MKQERRLEARVVQLERSQTLLEAQLQQQTWTDEELQTYEQLATEVAEGLAEIAEGDFESKRRLFEYLDVQVRLQVKDGLKVARPSSWLFPREDQELGVHSKGTNTPKARRAI